MVSDKDTNQIYFSSLLKQDYADEYNNIRKALNRFGIKPALLPRTNDIWARDYMPIQVSKNKFIEHRYDPDYLQGTKPNRRNLKTYPDLVCQKLGKKTIKSDIILDGGNVVKSSKAVILTDKIIRENQYKYTKSKLIDKLSELFEVEKVILIPADEECIYGHADGMLRFIDDDTVLVSGFYHRFEYYRNKITNALKSNGLKPEWLRIQSTEPARNISYINFLQTKDVILVPQLEWENQDAKALEEIKGYYKDVIDTDKIIGIEIKEITRKGGALNCISWTIKE